MANPNSNSIDVDSSINMNNTQETSSDDEFQSETCSNSDVEDENHRPNNVHPFFSRQMLNSSQSLCSPNNELDNFNGVEYLLATLKSAMGSLEFDKSLVLQSKMAGEINNTSNEIITTIDELKNCLKEHSDKFEKLQKYIIPEIESNLNQSVKSVRRMTRYVKERHPIAYAKGRDKVLHRVSNEDEDVELFL